MTRRGGGQTVCNPKYARKPIPNARQIYGSYLNPEPRTLNPYNACRHTESSKESLTPLLKESTIKELYTAVK